MRMDQMDLEKKIAALELELERAKAYQEIQNLFGRYMYLHEATRNTDCAELFAKDAPGVSVEFHQMGVFNGSEGIRKLYEETMGGNRKGMPGMLVEHTLTTPVIEIAHDGKTAKGIWISPGHETFVRDGRAQANWMWSKYALDFVKEGGTWKIWHYQVFMTFLCPFDTPWTDPSSTPTRPPMPNADGPTTYYKPYRVDGVAEYWPAPPDTYETFDGSRSMVGAPPAGFEA
jgi:hypothetical protein